MKNERTPRTLAECQFWCGYPIVRAQPAHGSRFLDWSLALAIGVAIGTLLARSI